MTVHKLSAGDGYAYYTSEVASADELRAGDRELGDYYTVEGMPPGQWVGHSEQLLGVSGEVTEAQMKALFGEGLHPEAASILAAGGTTGQIKLGQKYHQYGEADTDMTRRIDEEVARFRRTSGPAWAGVENADKALSREVMHEILSRVGGELFRESHGRNARSNEELARFITAQTTPKQQTVAGYDLVFSPAKSVSLLWVLGGDEARQAVEAAHHEAIKETIVFLEKNALYTRRGKNGVRQIDVEGGLVATQFRHYDSRAGDPQLHDHVVIANKVRGTDGKWSSVDGRTLYKMGVAASETYNAKVIEKVCVSLGVSTVARTSGGGEPVIEVAGIDLDAIHHASSRRADIAGAISRLESEFTEKHGYAPSEKQKIALAQQATLETRPEKRSARRLSELVQEWQKDYGMGLGTGVGMPVGSDLLEHVRAVSVQARSGAQAGPRVADLDVHEHARGIVHELSAKRAVWGRNHVIAQTRRHLKEAFPGQTVPDETVDSLIRAVTGTHSLQVTPEAITPRLRQFQRADGSSQFQQAGAALFTSHEVLSAEHKILAAGQKIVIPAVSTERFEKVLVHHAEALATTGGHALSAGQIDLARAFATDEKLLSLGIGPAGAGKTTSLSLAADAVRDSGGRVIGLAPTAAAAAVMSGDIGADATTIDAFLAAHRNQQHNQPHNQQGRANKNAGAFALGAGDVIIVDEAGMVTTPKLADVVAVAARNGAVVRAIGDDRQLGAIGSGGALRLLNNEVGAVRLEEVHRFRTDGESAASLALREPPAAGADTPFHWYLQNKRVTAGTTEAMTLDALAAWMTDTAAGKASLLIATDNATVTDLNARAQAARIATGDLGAHTAGGTGPITDTTPSVVLRDGLRAYAGDTVVTRKNDRTLQVNQGKDFVKNNDVWTVEQVTPDPASNRVDDTAADAAGNAAAGRERQRVTLRHTGHRGRITVDAGYLHEYGQLGYAATVHRAQGATVDTAHAILDEATDRAGAYVAATRGRETNRLYIALGDDNDQTVTRDGVLATIAANHDSTLSAHEAVRAESVRTGDVATLAGVYAEVENAAWEAKTRTIAASVLGPRTAVQFTSHDAWGAVATHLRAAETQGLDPAALLAQATGINHDSTGRAQHADAGHLRGFGDAQDPAAVLAYRLAQRIDAAHTLLTNADQRPLGAVSDEHLARLADQATKHAAGDGLPSRVPGEPAMDAGLDEGWAARPFALMRTDTLTDARTAALQRIQATDPTASPGTETQRTASKDQWRVQAMTVELERRQDSSPAQAAIERTARGEDPRSAHQVTIGDAIRHEQQLRAVALPQASMHASIQAASVGTVSEDLAPSMLLRDTLVPASYRAELDRLRAHLGQRVMVRGAQLAEEQPAWTNALGPVPGRDAKAAEWHRVAAETEAYRNQYNIGAHEIALIPKQYRDDPTAQRLIKRATALHKHGELTTVAPRTTTQIRQGADEATIADRMSTEQAAARRVIDRMRAERAASSDPLPAPQQREARIVDAAQSETAPQQTDGVSAAVARAIARHRAQAEAAAGTTTPDVAQVKGGPAHTAQDKNTKEPALGESEEAPRVPVKGSGWGARQAEVIRRRREAAATTEPRTVESHDASAATRRAEESRGRDEGRTRQ